MIKRLAYRFFRFYCDPDWLPDISGDLEELYQQNLKQSPRSAQWKYLLQVIMLFRPSLIRSIGENSIINSGMFKNYFKISVRNLMRHKVYAGINIIGLAIGLGAYLLISEYVRFEKSYDSFHQDADQLYRVGTVEVIEGTIDVKDAMATRVAGQVFEDEIPEVLNHTVSKKMDEIVFQRGAEIRRETGLITADPSFLELFNYPVIMGDPESMLSEPVSIVMTESKAKAYFGDENPIGQTITALSGYNVPCKVTGVIADIPENTHYKFDMMLSDITLADEDDYSGWNWNNYYLYVKLASDTDMEALQVKLDTIVFNRYHRETTSRWLAHPVQDIHLESDWTYEPQIHGSKNSVDFVQIISILVLIIAWVNYINLATARAIDRAREVGIRKVVGAFRRQLIGQFLFEALLINGIGGLIALLLSEAAIPYFNALVGKEILTHTWDTSFFLFNLGVFFLIGTILAGFYPAIVLSSFEPVSVLKGKYRNSKRGVQLRKGLVILQFTASLVLIACTFVVYQQVNYMQTRDKGIDTNHVVSFELPGAPDEDEETHRTKLTSFKEELRNLVQVVEVGATSNLPGGGSSDINATTTKVQIVGLTEPMDGTTYVQYNDDYFVDVMQMKILAGKDFDRNIKADSMVVMVNESFLKRLNVADPTQVIDEKLKFGTRENSDRFRIIGVVGDFNRTTLKSSVEPTVYFPWYHPPQTLVKLSSNYKEGLLQLESKWNEFFPDYPFDFNFVDERFATLYENDQRFGQVFAVFAFFALLVAILGLFGLASFMSLQRAKEVGVRKVLGASVTSIISIFYRDFLILVGVAGVIGVPTIYFIMSQWLENYAFRIDFPWWVTIVSVALVAIMALLTVGYQTYKVAIINPSKTLMYE